MLVITVHKFSEERSDERAEAMKKLISRFYGRSLGFLMCRDWASFESFAVEMLKCDKIPGFLQIAHCFETYLKTLFREVSKRTVLNENSETWSQDFEVEDDGAEPRVNL